MFTRKWRSESRGRGRPAHKGCTANLVYANFMSRADARGEGSIVAHVTLPRLLLTEYRDAAATETARPGGYIENQILQYS
jgi:hypothetical protein